MKRKWISKADIAVLLSLLLICGGLYFARVFPKDDAAVAEVTIGGETVLELDLQNAVERQTYTLENGVTLVAENHTVSFLSADCPDAVCVRTGALRNVGDVAACVPNETVVCVKGESRQQLDGITY